MHHYFLLLLWLLLKILILLSHLLHDKSLDLSKHDAYKDDKMNTVKIVKIVFDRVENIVEKGENGDYQHFLIFLPDFQKFFISMSLKLGIVGRSYYYCNYYYKL